MTNRKSSGVGAAVLVTVATVGAAAGAAMLARKRKGEIKEFVVANVLEKPAGRSSFTDLGQGLERGGTFLTGRAERAADTPENREVLAHIIGIERWGQSRLQVALGQREFVRDEYRGYRPAEGATLRQLQVLLSQTRARTVDLARQLHLSPPDDDFVVEHNGLGPLTAKGWLRYLTQHADLESRKLKSAGGAAVHEEESQQAPAS
ncbi:DinB family protein [Deinococcus wulumuqiensis]|uniref:DNA-binding protein n=1 Tax=Deinococcus wulumuqiensis TaxID=980427 RepID=A0A345IHJ4_9DEIO|nr:DinB family protein [Deinococcus wulumuqiensis]AXG99166.1 DinB family protein [Deinococcus wulumuqiensis]QII19373.1 DinB family protein [Deinococcus wulumuqiensis R12]GGP30731.1 DNA-binding protein [Deinococcus wulumuqiensis]